MNQQHTFRFVVQQQIPNTHTYRVISPTRDNFAAVNIVSRDDVWQAIGADVLQEKVEAQRAAANEKARQEAEQQQSQAAQKQREADAALAAVNDLKNQEQTKQANQRTDPYAGKRIIKKDDGTVMVVPDPSTLAPNDPRRNPKYYDSDYTGVRLQNPQDEMVLQQARSTSPVNRNNPGNVRDINTGRIATFSTPDEGAAATITTVDRYISGDNITFQKYLKDNNKTLATATYQDMVNVYAPASENDPISYARVVSSRLGISPQTPLTSLSSKKYDLVREMSRVEGPQSYQAWEASTYGQNNRTYWESQGYTITSDGALVKKK